MDSNTKEKKNYTNNSDDDTSKKGHSNIWGPKKWNFINQRIIYYM